MGSTDRPRVYMVCDWTDEKARSMDGCPNVGIEHLGNCAGRILREDGTLIGSHYSSTFGFLRSDLISKLDDPGAYEIVDLIGKSIPDRFKKELRDE